MRSPMMRLFDEQEKRDKRTAMLWSVFAGLILVALFVALGLAAVETLPDPATYSVVPPK